MLKRSKIEDLRSLSLVRRGFFERLVPAAAVLGGLAFGFLGFGSYYSLSRSSQIVPYFVTIDGSGNMRGGAAIEADENITERVISAELCAFIENLRGTFDDKALRRQAVRTVFAHLKTGTPLYEQMRKFYQDGRDLKKARLADISFQSVYRLTAQTFEIAFSEKTAQPEKTRGFRVRVSYELSRRPDASLETVRLNPSGLLVTEFVLTELPG